MLTSALINGMIWSVLWIAYVYMLLKCFPWEMVHEYPEDIKEKTTLRKPDEKQKKQYQPDFNGHFVSPPFPERTRIFFTVAWMTRKIYSAEPTG